MTKLRELKMPEQVTKVPSYAFAKCTVLSKVTFSKNMQRSTTLFTDFGICT